MIHVSGLTKSYGQWPVLSDVDLDLPDGELIGLVGANGAGKSTLLSVMARLLGADAGTVKVGGLNVATTPSDELAKVLCVLKQDNHMLVRLTVRDLVSFGRYPHNHGRPTEHDDAVVEKALAWMDLNDLAGRYLDQMSGGQRQRAFVAMVLAQETEYVLLDEPLNNLDIARSVEMMRMLERAAREFSRTIVIVLHDINFAARYASQVCALKDGSVAFMGTPEEIMRDEVLTDIFDTPVTVVPGPKGPIACYF